MTSHRTMVGRWFAWCSACAAFLQGDSCNACVGLIRMGVERGWKVSDVVHIMLYSQIFFPIAEVANA